MIVGSTVSSLPDAAPAEQSLCAIGMHPAPHSHLFFACGAVQAAARRAAQRQQAAAAATASAAPAQPAAASIQQLVQAAQERVVRLWRGEEVVRVHRRLALLHSTYPAVWPVLLRLPSCRAPAAHHTFAGL